MRILKLENNIESCKKLELFIKEWKGKRKSISQYTSGSTGTPQKIDIPKWKMKASARMTGDFLKLENATSALLCIDPKYIGGKMLIVRSLLYDLDLYLSDISRNPLKELKTPIDLVSMVPMQVEGVLKENPEKLHLIQNLIIGGAPISNELAKTLATYSCNAFSSFGMTETVSHIALKTLNTPYQPYKAIGNATFTTQKECLVINCEELHISNLKTNDVVQLIDERSFHWLGRSDFVINSGGVKIHPEKVEEKISAVMGEKKFIISQLPDKTLGSKVIFIGEKEIKETELKGKIENILPPYERPKCYFFVSSLSKTPSGKIDRIKTTQGIQ